MGIDSQCLRCVGMQEIVQETTDLRKLREKWKVTPSVRLEFPILQRDNSRDHGKDNFPISVLSFD